MTGLAYWSIYPDFDRKTPVPIFGSDEGKMHYVDVEFFNPDPAEHAYADDLSHKPAFGDVPRDVEDERYKEAGFLPFRVEQCYVELIDAISADRLSTDGEGRGPGVNLNTAEVWAGFMIHYLQDNTQPHHSTIDYKSESYFPNGRKPNVHGMMEYGFLDDEEQAYPELRAEYHDKVVEYVDRLPPMMFDGIGDPFATSLQMSLDAYDALPLIGRAAVAAVDAGSVKEPDLRVFANTRGPAGFAAPVADARGNATLMEVKAYAAALAVARTEAGLRQAWLEAHGHYHRPPEHRTPALSPGPATRPTAGVDPEAATRPTTRVGE